MKKIFFIPLFLILSLNTLVKGQTSLGIDDTSSFVQTNMYYATSYAYKATIKNYSFLAYSGPVQVFFAVDTMSNNTLVYLDSLTSTLNIPANDTISVSTTILTDSSASNKKFKSGINTVVIWPRSTSTPFTTHDSLKIFVMVVGYAGINNPVNTEKTIVFPNPMQNRLFIANKDVNFVIEQVRILDISGQLIYAEKFNGSIDVNKLASGAYTLEFLDKTGKTSRYKVIKE